MIINKKIYLGTSFVDLKSIKNLNYDRVVDFFKTY